MASKDRRVREKPAQRLRGIKRLFDGMKSQARRASRLNREAYFLVERCISDLRDVFDAKM